MCFFLDWLSQSNKLSQTHTYTHTQGGGGGEQIFRCHMRESFAVVIDLRHEQEASDAQALFVILNISHNFIEIQYDAMPH